MTTNFIKGLRQKNKSTPSLDTEEIISATNVAELLDEDYLKSLGTDLAQYFDDDDASRSGWLEKVDEYIKLALQYKEDKNFPHEGAANVKLPLLTISSLQFHGRAFPALINQNELVKFKVVGYDPEGQKLAKGNRVSRHMTYQLTEEMDEWLEDMDVALLTLPIVGCVFKKTYYDPIIKRCRSDLIFPNDVVVNYDVRRIEEAERIHHIIYKKPNDILEGINRGIYLDKDLQEGGYKPTDVGDDINGVSAVSTASSNVYKFVETHMNLDLDGDGYEEPYAILWDYNSRQVLRIVARYTEALIERNDKEDIVKITGIPYFTKYGFIPNPAGKFYDMGFGLLLGPLNETANSLVNQLLDAGRRNNTNTGFISTNFRPKGGTLRLKENEFTPVNGAMEDIKKGIYHLESPPPSPVLFQLLQHISQSAMQVGSVGDIIANGPPGQNAPLGTTQMVIEEGTKPLTAIFKRIHAALKKELQKIFFLNSQYLEDPTYEQILNARDAGQEALVRNDYDLESLDIFPASDPNISSKTQQMSLGKDLMEMARSGSPINPNIGLKLFLTGMDVGNVDELMNVPPPEPDPALVLKQQELQHRMEIEWATLHGELLKIEGNRIRDVVAAIAKIVEVEALQPGEQFQQAMAAFNQVNEEERIINDRAKVLSEYLVKKLQAEQKASEKSSSESGEA